VFPRLSSKASEILVEMYVNMRRKGKLSGRGKTVTGTTRQLESMIRLSEAHAKMRLSPIVEEVDVREAYRLIEEAMQSSAIDPMTGLVDLDLIQTGTSSRVRGVEEERRDRLRQVILSMDKNVVGFAECFGAYRKMFEEVSLFNFLF
jgi:DNA replication licensing factor MCM4